VDQQDIENELGAPGARELLASTSAAHLAYTGKDGTPRVIPVGFFWTGEQVVIATATTAVLASFATATVFASFTASTTSTTTTTLASTVSVRHVVGEVSQSLLGIPCAITLSPSLVFFAAEVGSFFVLLAQLLGTLPLAIFGSFVWRASFLHAAFENCDDSKVVRGAGGFRVTLKEILHESLDALGARSFGESSVAGFGEAQCVEHDQRNNDRECERSRGDCTPAYPSFVTISTTSSGLPSMARLGISRNR